MKVEELNYSLRPSHNLPDDNRYSMRNTVVGRFPDTRNQKKHKIKLSETIIQDIIKCTYTRDCLIGDAFKRFAKGRSGILTEAALKEGFMTYGIKLDSKSIKDTYKRLMGHEDELTDDLIDIAIEDNSKKGIEEIQKSIMEIINRGIKNQPEALIKEAFLKIDSDQSGEVSYEEFKKVIRIYIPKIRILDVMFLGKRYCIKNDDCILYEKFIDELDLLDRGINPLMSWAESLADTIIKAIAAQNTDFETLFRKYAPGKNYITESQFVEAMRSISVNSKFDPSKIIKFFYFIDDDKSQTVEFREMESIIKTHCTKTPQKLMDEILDEIKLQMDDRKVKVKDVYRTLDGYSRKELIDNGSFIRALKHDLKFHLDQIDLDFACKIYRDRKDKRSIRYSTFMDDLKQKFELTETYLVPGEKRRNPNFSSDPLAGKSFSRKDFTTPKKDEDIKIILKELRIELHDKDIDLKKEFQQ